MSAEYIWLAIWLAVIAVYYAVFVRRWLLEDWRRWKADKAAKAEADLQDIISEERYYEKRFMRNVQFQECENDHLGGDCPYCGAV
ncbi:hypothetical protein LCGC14_2240000 [marine sediment metagenome]|uniref:Uncharacterized protein n=1 Tax=marine sediment metagenome TaxID=412755 RepID=A0A0F9D5F8_9ZZZZ